MRERKRKRGRDREREKRRKSEGEKERERAREREREREREQERKRERERGTIEWFLEVFVTMDKINCLLFFTIVKKRRILFRDFFFQIYRRTEEKYKAINIP